jgi:hypothetical protein
MSKETKKEDIFTRPLAKADIAMICQQFSGQNFTQFFVYFRIPLVINNHW